MTSEGVEAVNEAIWFLKRARAVDPLRPSKGMSLAARDHVRDQGRSGRTGHRGSDGSRPSERVSRYGKWQEVIGENVSYGRNTGRGVVIQLIVDDGVPGRGHRKNLFEPDFRVTGIACGSHPAYRHACVIDLAGGYTEGKRTAEAKPALDSLSAAANAFRELAEREADRWFK